MYVDSFQYCLSSVDLSLDQQLNSDSNFQLKKFAWPSTPQRKVGEVPAMGSFLLNGAFLMDLIKDHVYKKNFRGDYFAIKTTWR